VLLYQCYVNFYSKALVIVYWELESVTLISKKKKRICDTASKRVMCLKI